MSYLGRMKPSSNAVAARNALLRRMVLNEGEARLGIEGFPAVGRSLRFVAGSDWICIQRNRVRLAICRTTTSRMLAVIPTI